MEKRFIDAHCHVFNKDIANTRILTTIARILYRTITRKTSADTTGAADSGMDSEKVKMLMSLMMKANSTDVYEEMDKIYQQKFAIVPLLFDMEYAFAEPESKSGLNNGAEETAFVKQRLEEQMNTWNQTITHESYGDDYRSVEQEYTQNMQRAKAIIQKMETERGIGDYLTKTSYERQISQVEALKAKYPDFIFPFYGIDPRRPGTKETFKKHLFPNGIFRGIKLYAPAGFSPLDPVLMDDDGVFAWCQEKNIPITAHCSYGGFASLMKRVRVSGMIHDKGKCIPVHNKIIEFHYNGLEGKWVEERADTLNHPLLWEEVLKKYPNLRLNLAHFGNGSEEWQNKILQMMAKYPNLYTDLSCWSERKEVKDVKYTYDNQPESIQKKFLYGSDFFLNLLFTDTFEGYLQNFKTVFADEFEKIAQENPARFLGM